MIHQFFLIQETIKMEDHTAIVRDIVEDIFKPAAFECECEESILLWLQREYSKLMHREARTQHQGCQVATMRKTDESITNENESTRPSNSHPPPLRWGD